MEKQKKILKVSNKHTEKFGDFFQNSLGYIFKGHKDDYLKAYVRCHWKDIVGEQIAKNAAFVGIEQKEILLYSKRPDWANELTLMQEEIISKVNAYAGKNLAKTLRFINYLKADKTKQQKVKNNVALQRSLSFDNLTKEETEEIHKSVKGVKDGDLANVLEKYKSAALKLKKYKEKNFIKCKICGAYNEGEVCERCAVEKEKRLKSRTVKLLSDAPFLSYAEAAKEIEELTPDLFHKIRVEMVQRMAKTVNGRDGVTFESTCLTMLYKGMRPEYITEDMVLNTLKKLRFDLAAPPRFEKKEMTKCRVKQKSNC
ncbi:MAG: DUF721 domain-containing protein [Selenomonadaceae bacterium]|nr:DUF721 domain-containing protein [Selenomonadaceae bacterium]